MSGNMDEPGNPKRYFHGRLSYDDLWYWATILGCCIAAGFGFMLGKILSWVFSDDASLMAAVLALMGIWAFFLHRMVRQSLKREEKDG